MRSRWLGLAALLAAGCNEGLIAPPPAVRTFLHDVPGPSGVPEAVGTWAYLVIPAVRIVLDVRGRLVGPQGAVNEPDLPKPEAHVEASALVGVYASDDQLLVLDTSGEFTLERQEGGRLFRQEGQWTLASGAVVLRASGEAPRRLVLTSGQEGLFGGDATFAPVAANTAPQDAQDEAEGALP
jgi:hypothetical protein